MKCLSCEQENKLESEEEVENPARNFELQGVVECVKVIERRRTTKHEEERKVNCSNEGCGREGVVYCHTEGVWMCEQCQVSHDSCPFAKNHKSEMETTTRTRAFCERYSQDKPLYCLDCSQLVCAECHHGSHHLSGLSNQVNTLFGSGSGSDESSSTKMTKMMNQVEQNEKNLVKEQETLEQELREEKNKKKEKEKKESKSKEKCNSKKRGCPN